MKQYQAVIFRLQNKHHEDEEALTDLLNERARGGWTLERTAALSHTRIVLVFARQSE